MKETIRTASVLEIYNEAIDNLIEERKSLQIELASLQGTHFIKQNIRRIWNLFWKIVLTVLGVILIIFGLAVIITDIIFIFKLITSFSLSESQEYLFEGPLPVIGLISPFLGIKLIKKVFKSKNMDSETLNQILKIKKRLAEIEEEIDSRKQRKKSLLEAEEVIASKDLKTEKASIDDDNPTEKFDANKLSDKICPMCAETVKSAAKICRFCNHKF